MFDLSPDCCGSVLFKLDIGYLKMMVSERIVMDLFMKQAAAALVYHVGLQPYHFPPLSLLFYGNLLLP